MNLWHYLLLVNIYLMLFYGFYALLLRKETFFQLNRIYLVSASLLSFIIPVIQAGWVRRLFITEEVRYSIYGQTATINFYALHPVQSSPITVGQVLLALYVAGMAFLTIRFALQLIKVNKLLKTPEPSAAYAFFNKINIGENALDQKAVLAHEQVHARQLHSLDVLLIETVMIINWFNPVVYLYRFAVKHIHEYIADQQVIKIGADKAEYAMLLVSQTFSAPQHGLVSAFAGSLLKKRIKMLQKDRSKRIVLFKYMLSAPLFGLMLILSSATIDDNKAVNLIRHQANKLFDQPAKAVIDDIVLSDDDDLINHGDIASGLQEEKIYERVDKMPEFPGGMDGFNSFLAKNVHYPAGARKKGEHGRVFIQFVVETNGSVTNVKAVRSPSEELSTEAVRAIKRSPKWTPGVLAGKKVRTSYTVPVNFTLESVGLAPPGPPKPKVTNIVFPQPVINESPNSGEKVYEAVEHEPEFVGGQDAFNRFLASVVKFPAIDRENNVTGKVYVSFIVESDGTLTNIKAVRGPSKTEMAEAVRGVALSPKWRPGIQNGKAVRVNYTVPVNFTLSDGQAGNSSAKDKVYEAVEFEPEFPGGQEAFNHFLSTVVRFPAIDRQNNVTGKVYVTFIVEPDGSLTDVRAVRGPSETEKAEAVRGVTLSPKWKPGVQNGKAVRVNYTMPVNFTLSNDNTNSATIHSAADSTQHKADGTVILKGNVRLRAGSGANQPLIIVNGKEYTKDLNTINANDIIAVSVLKDQTATKKYGEKGKNGVIEIETRTKQ